MAANPCIADTNSVDLGQDGSGNLIATVRRDPAGAIAETASGLKVDLAAPSGLLITGDKLKVDVVQGLVVETAGMSKINSSQVASGSFNLSTPDDTTHSFAILRGATTAVGSALATVTNLDQATTSYVWFHARWSGLWQTTFAEFGPSAINDSVYAYLQYKLDAGGFQNVDKVSLNAWRQACSFRLSAMMPVPMINSVSHTVTVRLVVQGGTASATAQQGAIQTSYMRRLEIVY